MLRLRLVAAGRCSVVAAGVRVAERQRPRQLQAQVQAVDLHQA